jgi:hypothetical protein
MSLVVLRHIAVYLSTRVPSKAIGSRLAFLRALQTRSEIQDDVVELVVGSVCLTIMLTLIAASCRLDCGLIADSICRLIGRLAASPPTGIVVW